MFIKFMDVFVIRFRQKLPHFNFWGESQIVNPNYQSLYSEFSSRVWPGRLLSVFKAGELA